MSITPNIMGRGQRSYFIYHPRSKECREMVFETGISLFREKWRTAIEIAQLWHDENPGSQEVYGEEQRREINDLLKDIEKEKDLYLLESLAEYLWGGDQEVTKKFLPYYHEIKKRSMELRALDSNLLLAQAASSMNKIINPNSDTLKQVLRSTRR